MTHSALEIVNDVCNSFDGNGIYSIGANGALRAMAVHWSNHLAEGNNPKIISNDIAELIKILESMKVEIIKQISEGI